MRRALVSSVLLVACGSDPLNDPPKEEPSATCPDGPTNDDVCIGGPGYAEGAAEIDIGSVSATIVDADGEPIADLAVFVCGTKVCSLPAHTDADGSVTIGFSAPIEKPAFKYGDGLEVGRFFPLHPENAEAIELGTIGTPRLPAPGACLSPGEIAESGGVRLTLSPDAAVELLPLDYPEPEDRTFRAAELPLALAAPGLDAGEGLDAIFALAPVGAIVCPPATLELPNTLGLAAGTEVDILVHGADVEEEWAPYGAWMGVAIGRVDAAGERIETIEGGIPYISTVGVRAR
jgi:hypothetical protein